MRSALTLPTLPGLNRAWSLGAPRQYRHNRISCLDTPATDHFGKDTLSIVHHLLAQSLANRIHFLTGVARCVKQKHGVADLYLSTDQGNQIDTRGFDVGPNGARRNGL